MDLQLTGKRALVTGSNTGIGKGIARVLAEEGAIVVVHGRDRARAEKVAAELVAKGGRAEVAVGDLSLPEGAQSVVDQVRALGPLDILVNNAGGSESGAVSDWLATPEETWESTWRRNVMGPLRMIRAFAPEMKERGWGRIINIGSTGSVTPMPEIPEYQSSKAALLSLTLSLSKALADTGVTVNVVSPGPVLTPAPRHWIQGLAKEQGRDFDELAAEIAREQYRVTVGRWGNSEEIGSVVALVASPRSDYTSGANFHVDGGATQGLH